MSMKADSSFRLPAWLEAELPEARPEARVIVVAEGYAISWTDENSLWLLQEAYASWLNFYREWQENKDDFLSAYYFIDQHPAFWTRLKHEKTFQWHTADGRPDTIIPCRDDTGQVCISLETGGHVEPAYTEHYHDYRLDVTEPTFEEAIVALAKRVDEIFDETGCERPEAPEYPPPAYLVEALEALKRHEERKKA